MSKDIVLPITCDQLKHGLLISVTIIFIISVLQVFNWDNLTFNEQILVFCGVMFGGMGVFVGWFMRLMTWSDNGVFRIRCRCDKNNE